MLTSVLKVGFVVATLTVSANAASAQTSPSGETLFRQRCGSCHTVQGTQNRMGPALQGVVGRKAGTAPGYNYSPALREWGRTWTVANLELYLAAPRTAVPGTKMSIVAPSPAQRAEIIRYLQTQR
ncbi:c-type cytochrome [Brevundimonas diminuta]|uniref:c-type cytochrome n=1 Tax=Brevundimonas diminuta TaxID=293 RepID=UPI00320816DB